MTLVRSDLLWAGALAATLLVLALAVQSRRLARLRRALGVAAARLIPVERGRLGTRLACLLVAAGAVGLAAAGPRPSTPAAAEPPAPLDLAVAVDLSLSMTAGDVEPSRLVRAQQVVEEIADALPSARISLVVFADWPYALVPLTDDLEVVRWFARSLTADAVPERHRGTSLSLAIDAGRGALDARPRDGARRAVLILSDGAGHDGRDAAIAAATAASEAGVSVWTGGLGTARGAELGTVTDPILDARGVPVVASLDADILRAIADAGGGRYGNVADEGRGTSLAAGLSEAVASAPAAPTRTLDAALWLTLLALPLLLWEGALDGGRGLPRRDASRRQDT